MEKAYVDALGSPQNYVGNAPNLELCKINVFFDESNSERKYVPRYVFLPRSSKLH